MDDTSNTGDNRKPGTFQKGDPRINRKGRPKSFDALRVLSLQIAHEEALKDGHGIVINGHRVTVAENIMRQWAHSDNPALQKAFVEIAFGKVPDEVNIGNKDNNPFQVEVVPIDYRIAIANLAPRPVGDSTAPGEGEDTFDGPEMG